MEDAAEHKRRERDIVAEWIAQKRHKQTH